MTEAPHPEPVNREAVGKALAKWTEISKNPGQFLADSNRPGTAFGNGVILLGMENEFWNSLSTKAVDGRISIAGVSFETGELSTVGGFYRHMQGKGVGKGFCMDERIDPAAPHADSGIHEHCGAAAAQGAVLGVSGAAVEDTAMRLTGEGARAELITGMEHDHESVTIYADLGKGTSQLRAEQASSLRDNYALPFHTSMSLSAVLEYADANGLEPAYVLTSLMKWNVQIAANIINGGHNKYSREAALDGIIVAKDTRGQNLSDPRIATLSKAFDDYVEGMKSKQKVEQLEIK